MSATRAHGAADHNAAQSALDDLARERAAAPSHDALRAQLAAVTAELDALRAAVRDAARNISVAFNAIDTAFSGPAQDAAHEDLDAAIDALRALAAPAHNPGARVVPTGGGR